MWATLSQSIDTVAKLRQALVNVGGLLEHVSFSTRLCYSLTAS